jgi:hypothetical protein
MIDLDDRLTFSEFCIEQYSQADTKLSYTDWKVTYYEYLAKHYQDYLDWCDRAEELA